MSYRLAIGWASSRRIVGRLLARRSGRTGRGRRPISVRLFRFLRLFTIRLSWVRWRWRRPICWRAGSGRECDGWTFTAATLSVPLLDSVLFQNTSRALAQEGVSKLLLILAGFSSSYSMCIDKGYIKVGSHAVMTSDEANA